MLTNDDLFITVKIWMLCLTCSWCLFFNFFVFSRKLRIDSINRLMTSLWKSENFFTKFSEFSLGCRQRRRKIKIYFEVNVMDFALKLQFFFFLMEKTLLLCEENVRIHAMTQKRKTRTTNFWGKILATNVLIITHRELRNWVKIFDFSSLESIFDFV